MGIEALAHILSLSQIPLSAKGYFSSLRGGYNVYCVRSAQFMFARETSTTTNRIFRETLAARRKVYTNIVQLNLYST